MEIQLTLKQFEVLKKLVAVAKDAISRGATAGEATSDSDKVEWNTEVKFTIS